MLRIKLVKIGKKDLPTWRVVVVEKTKTGKGVVTDYIGNYNPHKKPKEFRLDLEAYAKWVGNGAQPTDTVKRLKGNFIDKNKAYQEEVKAKVYKRKKPQEQETKKTINQENKEEAQGEKVEAVVEEAPIEEAKEDVVEETSVEAETKE